MKEKSKYAAQVKYAKNNLVKIGIDVKPEIRDTFKEICLDNNTTYTKVLKDFINDYIQKNKAEN